MIRHFRVLVFASAVAAAILAPPAGAAGRPPAA